jgi:hypothetical protein
LITGENATTCLEIPLGLHAQKPRLPRRCGRRLARKTSFRQREPIARCRCAGRSSRSPSIPTGTCRFGRRTRVSPAWHADRERARSRELVHPLVLPRLSSTTRAPWRSVILAFGQRSHAAR